MIRLRTLGLALVVVFAMGAVAVSSASAALPEFAKSGVCQKPGGKKWSYTEKKCLTLSGTHEGEWGESTFTDESGKGTLETVGGLKVECESDTSWGETPTPKKVNEVVVVFHECKSPLLEEPCQNATSAAGEIRTNELEGEIGYIKVGETKVGLDLWPESRTAAEKAAHEFNALFVTFECSKLPIEVKGSVIGEIKPINTKVGPGKATTHFTLTYNQALGVQSITKLPEVEGGVKDVLMTKNPLTGNFEESAEATVDEVFPFAATELEA